MQDLIDNNRMVEWGQYHDNFYGTCVDAVKDSANNDKICVITPMNLKQAMRVLVSKEIQGYVVFVTILNQKDELALSVRDPPQHATLNKYHHSTKYQTTALDRSTEINECL